MAVPYLHINSMSYTSSVITLNNDYSYLRGGGSFSIVGLPQTLYFNATNSYVTGRIATFSLSLSASTTYNLTFSFYKGPYINYPLDQPSLTGVTGASTYGVGGQAYNLGLQPLYATAAPLYEIRRTFNYKFTTTS